jgi:hypothetical protein
VRAGIVLIGFEAKDGRTAARTAMTTTAQCRTSTAYDERFLPGWRGLAPAFAPAGRRGDQRHARDPRSRMFPFKFRWREALR